MEKTGSLILLSFTLKINRLNFYLEVYQLICHCMVTLGEGQHVFRSSLIRNIIDVKEMEVTLLILKGCCIYVILGVFTEVIGQSFYYFNFFLPKHRLIQPSKAF
jgi:hypothetical protein